MGDADDDDDLFDDGEVDEVDYDEYLAANWDYDTSSESDIDANNSKPHLFWKPGFVPEPALFNDMSPDIINAFGLNTRDGWLFAMDAVFGYIEWCADNALHSPSLIAPRSVIALKCLKVMLCFEPCPFPLSRDFLFREACDLWRAFHEDFVAPPPWNNYNLAHTKVHIRDANNACNAISRSFNVSKDVMRKLSRDSLFLEIRDLYEDEIPWKWFLSYAEDSEERLSTFISCYQPWSIIFHELIVKTRSASEGEYLSQTPLLANKALVDNSCERKIVEDSDVGKKPGKNARKKAARVANAVDKSQPLAALVEADNVPLDAKDDAATSP